MIQVRRGLKANLPVLKSGEPAFTTDSKELYIGDGTTNYNMTPNIYMGSNLIVNGNFQVCLEESDASYPVITITPGTSKYIFGNFYISNSNLSTGNVVITRAFNSSNITIAATNAIVSFEYREKTSKYINGASTFTTSTPLITKNVTLSYDYSNSMAQINNISCGTTVLSPYSIPSGNGRLSQTFICYYANINSYPTFKVVILSTSTAQTFTLTLGNIKVELGNIATPFSPNSLLYDASALSANYRKYSVYVRATQISANYISFLVPYNTQNYFNYNIKFNLLSSAIYNLQLQVQTGFTTTFTRYSNTDTMQVLFTKTAHLLTDASALIEYEVDYRP